MGNPAVDRAVRLFEFLARAQQIKATPVRRVENYESVLWLGDLPQHPAVTSAWQADIELEPGHLLLAVERVPYQGAPEPNSLLRPWLDGALDDPTVMPRLRESIGDGEETVHIDDTSSVRSAFQDWSVRWSEWAERERLDLPVRDVYRELFATYIAATGHTEELELVVAVGCLSWSPAGYQQVVRHVLTTPALIHFDDDTGRLSVHQADNSSGVTLELDMLDPRLVATNPQHVNRIKAEARVVEASILDRGAVGELVRRLVHAIGGDGVYVEDAHVPEPAVRAVAAFAPAVIMRKRSTQGLIDLLETVATQLSEFATVPDGLLPLVDPDHRPAATSSHEPGALVHLDDEPFLPLPVNEMQLQILNRVDTKAQTVVQGPPGTGKTHTAAALLSHLLAQGKRVLVTAHTDRALKEVRAKLPSSIAPLAVSVVGSSRSDMSELKVAVERISTAAGEYDAEVARRNVDEHLAAIDVLRRERAALHRRLLDARLDEVSSHEIGNYRGTLAGIAQRVEAERGRFGWLAELVDIAADGVSPVSGVDVVYWYRSLVDDALNADEPDSRLRLVELGRVPDPEAFAALVAAEHSAISAAEQMKALTLHPAFPAVFRLDRPARASVRTQLDQIVRTVDELARGREAWTGDALVDVRAGRSSIWTSRGDQISQLIVQVGPLVDRLGPVTEVVVTGVEAGVLVALATALRQHLAEGGKIKTNPDGSPKVGAFVAKAVKHAEALFGSVRVNGVPPTTPAQLDAFLLWAEATRFLDALDKAWPESVTIPMEDTLRERLQWHQTELEQLGRVLALGQAITTEELRLAEFGLPTPDWNDLDAIRTYAQLTDVAAATDARSAATAPLTALAAVLDEVIQWSDVAECVRRLGDAARARDHEGYATAHDRLARLTAVLSVVQRRDEIRAQLAVGTPGVCAAVSGDPDDQAWSARLSEWDEAWVWARNRAWLLGRRREDVNDLQAAVSIIDERIRDQVERLAAERAWGHAVSPQRLSGRARANLQQYAQLVRALGKGTGKYAGQRRAEIRDAMDRCRPAVPVWIMPIYRIGEQLRVQPDMFDVVVVDEASQAGLEATFLQYLAPRIVVIGDDKQVSPSAVGVDQQQLRDLADQYLWDDPYRASWQNPKHSFFDEAKMRFEGTLTLTEHRRCVPEIIGFSNRIAYEPEGIRLIPVRQYGADRLEPVKTVFLEDGYERGGSDKINPAEVDAIVDQIEKCIADPRYDGLTFGVISLLGHAQASVIEKRLLERVPPEEWAARELRCGDSADFQGSERNVMFLSMVKAADPSRRIGALTQEQYVQRFNVAASRARDQMWVFHSVRLSDLGNPDDMRFALLDYCYGVIGRAGDESGAMSAVVPEDRRVEPFDSLFEQRVFNRLVDRGYSVIPQFPAMGYRLDLVVVGARARLAVECDGDAWHGPDAYERDLARQRDLERCDWRFFRIRESEFYADRSAVLARLWNALQELDIHPSGWSAKDGDTTVEVVDAPTSTIAVQVVEHAPVEMTGGELIAAGTVEEAVIAWPTMDEPAITTPTTVETFGAPNTGPLSGEAAKSGLVRTSAPPNSGLAMYEVFSGRTVPVGDASLQELADGIERLVAIEGPVLGQRLHTAYVRASGGMRVGKLIAAELDKSITRAVRAGRLVEENPLDEAGVKPRTFRLPGQPSVRVRELGPRSFEEIPPQELTALMDQIANQTGLEDQTDLQRAALELLGLKRLTDNVKSRFAAVSALRS